MATAEWYREPLYLTVVVILHVFIYRLEIPSNNLHFYPFILRSLWFCHRIYSILSSLCIWLITVTWLRVTATCSSLLAWECPSFCRANDYRGTTNCAHPCSKHVWIHVAYLLISFYVSLSMTLKVYFVFTSHSQKEQPTILDRPCGYI